MKPVQLTEHEIRSGLETLRGWEKNPRGEIARVFQFKDFAHALLFVNAVGHAAEKMDHHPDIDIRWNKVTLSLVTHSAGGLTRLDFELARQADALAD